MTDETFYKVSDCSVLDGCGRVVGVMRDHWVAHELVDMAARDEEWVDPEMLGDEHQDVVDGFEEQIADLTKQLVRSQEQLEEQQQKEFKFRQWASARIGELEELLGEQGKETGRVELE